MRSYTRRIDVYRNGAKVTELKAVEAPTVNADSSAQIKMSMSGTFLYNPLVDYLNDDLKAWQIIDGIAYPVGVFPVGTYQDIYTENGAHHVRLEAYDRCFRLQQTRTESILHMDSGTNYIDAVGQLLVGADIGLYLSTPTDLTLTTAREWDIGTDYLTIANELLSEINYQSIWFNADGYAVLQPAVQPDASRINHYYDSSTKLSVLRPDCTSETDIFDKPNVFIVVCGNPDLPAPLTATAENNNPLSALSIFKRGRRIASVYNVDNIASQTELDKYAQRLCQESILSSEVVTFQTANMPNHGVYDILAISHPEIQGIFQETSWSMSLEAGALMTHTARRSILI